MRIPRVFGSTAAAERSVWKTLAYVTWHPSLFFWCRGSKGWPHFSTIGLASVPLFSLCLAEVRWEDAVTSSMSIAPICLRFPVNRNLLFFFMYMRKSKGRTCEERLEMFVSGLPLVLFLSGACITIKGILFSWNMLKKKKVSIKRKMRYPLNFWVLFCFKVKDIVGFLSYHYATTGICIRLCCNSIFPGLCIVFDFEIYLRSLLPF